MSESPAQGPIVPPKGTALALLGAGQYGVGRVATAHACRPVYAASISRPPSWAAGLRQRRRASHAEVHDMTATCGGRLLPPALEQHQGLLELHTTVGDHLAHLRHVRHALLVAERLGNMLAHLLHRREAVRCMRAGDAARGALQSPHCRGAVGMGG
eukprot:scaffold11062_cov24-Phaeocystis_antarctica.AAC.2